MRAGQLRHRVTIEYPQESQDDYGEPVKTWTKLVSVWAKKEDLSGSELYTAQQITSRASTRFTLRYRTDIDARMRVAHGEDLYSIEAPIDMEGRKRELILLCARSRDE